MRILHLAQDALPYSTGGVEVYVERLAQALAAAGVEVELFAARDPGERNTYEIRRELRNGLSLTTIAHRTGNEWLHALRLARDFARFDRNPKIDRIVGELVRQAAPDVVHVHHLVHLSTSLLGEIERLGLPIVTTLHDYWWLCVAGQLLNGGGPHEPEECGEACLRYLLFNRHKAFGAFGGLLSRYTRARRRFFTHWVRDRQRLLVGELGRSRLVISPSRSLRDRFVRAGLDPARVEVADYGTETGAIARRVRSRNGGTLRFGFLGRLVPEKGPHLLLEAFRGLAGPASLDFHAAPAPNASYGRALRALASVAGARFRGPYSSNDVGLTLNEIDALVVPSIWWENSPIVIHEAFAAGVPVIAARAGGMAELVEDESNGLLFDLGSSADLRRAMLRMLEPGVLERLSRGTSPPRSMDEDAAWHLAAYRRLAAPVC